MNMAKATIQSALILLVILFVMAVYGSIQLYYRSDRLDLIESQRARIVNLETKVMFLENNDWAFIIQQLPPIIQDELKAMNERIKQKKHRVYEATEQPIITEREKR